MFNLFPLRRKVWECRLLIVTPYAGLRRFVLDLDPDGIGDFGDADGFQAEYAVGVEESCFACLVKGVGSAADTGQGDVLVEYGVAERDDSEC